MLSRRSVGGTLIAAVLGGALALTGSPAAADHKVICPPDGGSCTIEVHTPGNPGEPGDDGGNGGGGPAKCSWAGQPVPCHIRQFGWFNPNDGCYYALMTPQPPAESDLWEGHEPGEGAVYLVTCYPPDSIDPLGIGGIGTNWLATPPPGFGGLPSPAQLAARAVNQLPIRGPRIRTAPAADGSGLVGLPVWLWTPATEATWGPASATASVPGLSVTATARAEKIVWDMGDGNSVTCTTPGTPYRPSFGRKKSPDCGYDKGYQRPSSTVGGRYKITGATTWRVTWAGGGQTGELTVTRSSSTTIDIDELQVITS